MTDLFAWLVKEDDGAEGIIAAIFPYPELGDSPVPLVAASERIAKAMTTFASLHAEATGKPVRLVWFVEAETLEKL